MVVKLEYWTVIASSTLTIIQLKTQTSINFGLNDFMNPSYSSTGSEDRSSLFLEYLSMDCNSSPVFTEPRMLRSLTLQACDFQQDSTRK